MAELLIRVIDKVNDDPVKDAWCSKRGDVVIVCPDGWKWSEIEKKNPDWRIIKVPLTVEGANVFLLSQDDGKDEFHPTKSKKLLRRAVKFDLDDAKVPKDIKADILDEKRTNPVIDVKTFDINTIKVTKAFK